MRPAFIYFIHYTTSAQLVSIIIISIHRHWLKTWRASSFSYQHYWIVWQATFGEAFFSSLLSLLLNHKKSNDPRRGARNRSRLFRVDSSQSSWTRYVLTLAWHLAALTFVTLTAYGRLLFFDEVCIPFPKCNYVLCCPLYICFATQHCLSLLSVRRSTFKDVWTWWVTCYSFWFTSQLVTTAVMRCSLHRWVYTI